MTVNEEISEAILSWSRKTLSPVEAACTAMKDWHDHFITHNRCRSDCPVSVNLYADWQQKFHLFYVWRGWAYEDVEILGLERVNRSR